MRFLWHCGPAAATLEALRRTSRAIQFVNSSPGVSGAADNGMLMDPTPQAASFIINGNGDDFALAWRLW